MSLAQLGYDGFFSDSFSSLAQPGLVPARVVSNLGTRFQLAGARATYASLAGRLRHELTEVERPTVGDWVAVADGASAEESAVIQAVLPRRTELVRRAAGTQGGRQVVAANVDTFAVVTSANRDANPRRLERYLVAIADSGAAAVVVVNKVDLCSAAELSEVHDGLARVAPGVPILVTSAATGDGVAALLAHVGPGGTLALIGMSGVGKSSLVNRLLGAERQAVLPIDADDRGRHATSRRELVALPGGGILIDTPGMRELGLTEDEGGIAAEFSELTELAAGCRFRDCRHAGEPGCAVAAAIDDGALAADRLAAFHKLEREVEAAERRQDPVLAAQRRQRRRSISLASRARTKVDPKLQR
jgi:ribosome biogenesis GTPase